MKYVTIRKGWHLPGLARCWGAGLLSVGWQRGAQARCLALRFNILHFGQWLSFRFAFHLCGELNGRELGCDPRVSRQHIRTPCSPLS